MKIILFLLLSLHIPLFASVEDPLTHVNEYVEAQQKQDFETMLMLLKKSTTQEFYNSILNESGDEAGFIEVLKSSRREYDSETLWIADSQEEAAKSYRDFYPPFGDKKVPSNYQLVFYGDHENQSHIVFHQLESGWVAIDPAKFYREVMK